MINSAIQMLFCHEPDLMGGGGEGNNLFCNLIGGIAFDYETSGTLCYVINEWTIF